MPRTLLGHLIAGVMVSSSIACAAGAPSSYADDPAEPTPAIDNGVQKGTADAGPPEDLLTNDASADGMTSFNSDAACAAVAETATVEALPVDIIWIVDNSSSMAPAVVAVQTGLNAFASVIGAKNLDYHVVMLSLRNKTSHVTSGGTTRYPVCIPQPLAGDAQCGNGARFFQSSMDIKSTQPLEQLLGTLDQTAGYKMGEDRGGEPWAQTLRPNATKTIVVVTDDNSRLTPYQLDNFAGGPNPGNAGLTLPPGLLHASRNGQFDGYVFNAIYGASIASAGAVCSYANGTKPPNAGSAYTQLVAQTGGVRAEICDSSAAWSPFFDAVAQAVIKTSKLACDLAIPVPKNGTLDPNEVNVQIDGDAGKKLLVKVAGEAACANDLGWYYDDDKAPTKVLLCPKACDAAQGPGGMATPNEIRVLFGCKSVVK